jgi:hypothetical protein
MSVLLTRWLLKLAVDMGITNPKFYGVKEEVKGGVENV